MLGHFERKKHRKIVIGFYKEDEDFPKIIEPDISLLDTTTMYAMHRASIKAFSLGWKETSGWEFLPLTNDFKRYYKYDSEKRILFVHLFESDLPQNNEGLIKSITLDYKPT